MTACVACGASAAHELWRVRGFPIVACDTCGLARTELPADFDPASIYTASYFDGGQDDGYADYQGSQETLRAEFARTLDGLARHGVMGGSLIELGCAYGYFLDEARRRFSVCGVEVADAARAACRERGLVVERELTPALAAEHGPFDAAVMLDVIEHLADPGEVLVRLRGTLRAGGRLLLTTGDFGAALARVAGRRWRLMTPPQHLWFFSPKTLEAVLTRSGFRLLALDHPWKLVPLSMIVFQSLRMAGLRSPSWIRRLPGGVPVNLFDAMRVVAEAV
jgi:SAM-dependent methyltransferase